MPDSPRTRLLAKLDASLCAGAFVKLTLSEYRGAETGLRNVYARAVELRDGLHLSLTSRYATRDVTKNVPLAEATATLGKLPGAEFARAHLFTTTGDWQLQCDALSEGKLKASRPAFAVAPPPEHDQKKRTPLAVEHAPFLHALGVTSATGEARPGMAGTAQGQRAADAERQRRRNQRVDRRSERARSNLVARTELANVRSVQARRHESRHAGCPEAVCDPAEIPTNTPHSYR